MSKDKDHIIYTARDIEQYLAGNLSAMQMHAMEKAALDDPFLAEAIEGYEANTEKEWNNDLVALRTQIAAKGAVAKVIPLHKTKNNWWKSVAAVLVLGLGAMLTYTLTKNKTEDKGKPQIAQTIAANKDSTPQANVETPAPVTISLNPSASATKEEISSTKAVVIVKNNTVITDDKKTASPVSSDVAVSAPVTTANNQQIGATRKTGEANENTQRTDEAVASKPNNNEIESVVRPKAASAKKEQTLNNYFTAQVVGTDNSPLPFTNISIKKDNFGTYADAKGMVRLVSTDSILYIEVKSVGYMAKTFALRNNQAQTKIVLQENQLVYRDQVVIGNKDKTTPRKSRRATLVKDSAVNVEPADGWDNYNTYVANNLDIPESMLKSDYIGEVELTFEVRSNGTISNVQINKSLGTEYDEAAKRLLLEGPQWKVKKGKKTRASVKVQF